jgi:O-antigen/teichoic acid export membrane protein
VFIFKLILKKIKIHSISGLSLINLIAALISFFSISYFSAIFPKEAFGKYYLATSFFGLISSLLTLNTQYLIFRNKSNGFNYSNSAFIVGIASLIIATLAIVFGFLELNLKPGVLFLYIFLTNCFLGLVVLKQSILISKNKIKKYGISILFVAILSFILRLTFSNSNSSNSLIMIYFFSIFINYIIIFNPKDVKIKPDNLTQYLQKNKSLIVSRSIQTFVNQTNYSGFILFLSKLCSIDEIAQIGIISTILMIPNMVFGKAGSDFYLSKYTKKNPNLIEWKRDILKFSLLSFLTMVAILLSPEKAFRFLFSDLGIGIKHYLIAFIPLYLGNLFNKPIMALVNVKGYDSVMLKWEIISTILKYFIILFLVNYLALNLYNIIFTFSILSLLSYIVLGLLVRKKEFDFEISSLR